MGRFFFWKILLHIELEKSFHSFLLIILSKNNYLIEVPQSVSPIEILFFSLMKNKVAKKNQGCILFRKIEFKKAKQFKLDRLRKSNFPKKNKAEN
jgi:hypothetical protein